MKKWFNFTGLLPAAAVGMAVVLGLQMTTPTLNEVVWPDEPNITVEAKEKNDKKAAEATTEAETEAGVGNYTDGVFTGVGVGYGGNTEVQVTVEKKQITAVDILSNHDTASFFNKAKDTIVSEILTAQTWEVDSVSGATYSSRGIKDAVCNALTGQVSDATQPEQVKPKNSLSNSEFKDGDWTDGTYEGSANGFGGKIRVSVTIKDGKITSIKVLSHSGETSSYYNKATAIISRIIKAQSPNVDTVSGATYSSTGIREAVKNALNKAVGKKKKKTATKTDTTSTKKTTTLPTVKVPSGTPADGTYTGTATCEQSPRFSYSVTVSATYKNGKLVSLSMKSTDDGSNATYLNRAWETLEKELLSNMSGNVDTVSRATYSSNAIRVAYMLAYKKAIEANGGSLDDTTETTTEDTTEATTEDTTGTTPSFPSISNPKITGTTPLVDKDTGSNNGDATLEGTPADGVYKETVTVNSYDATKTSQQGWFENYTLSGKVTFKDGKLTDISSVTIESADDYEWDDDQYYTDKASSTVISNLKKAQSNQVDTVSGATCSSKAVIALYEKAFKEAVAANKDTASATADVGKAYAKSSDKTTAEATTSAAGTTTATTESTEASKAADDKSTEATTSEEKKSEETTSESNGDKKSDEDTKSSDDKKNDDKDSKSSDDKKDEKDTKSSDEKKDEKDTKSSDDKKDEKDTKSSDSKKDDKDKKDTKSSDDKKDKKDTKSTDDAKDEKTTESK